MIGLVIAALQTVRGADPGRRPAGRRSSSFLVFPTTIETLTRGKSLGKLAFGLRTVRDDAGPISFQHSFVRALIGVVEIYVFMGVPAFFSALLSSRGKRLGDYAAGTYVVRERVKLQLSPPPPMPPQLASWAAGADMASLPTGLALAVRQFLGRLPQIDPASRAAIGGRLAGAVQRVRRSPAAAAAPRPRRSSPRSPPPAASATRRGWPARPSCGGGSPPADEHAARPGDVLVHLRRARDHADRHYAEPLDLDELAAIAGLSKFHFQRLFKATYGRTPGGVRLAAPGRASAGPAPRHQPDRHRGLPRGRVLQPGLVQQQVPRARRRDAERVPAAVRRDRGAPDPRAATSSSGV